MFDNFATLENHKLFEKKIYDQNQVIINNIMDDNWTPYLKSINFFTSMYKAGQLTSKTLQYAKTLIKPGINTLDIDKKCEDFIRANNGIPACIGYKKYKHSICASLNNVVCHGVPKSTIILKDGDMINIDIVTNIKGFHGDASRVFCVGSVSPEVEKVINVAKLAMLYGISLIKPGVTTGFIGKSVEKIINKYGFFSVKEFCGHGIGLKIHQDPIIQFIDTKRDGYTLKEGDCITIEPMVNMISPNIMIDEEDKWTVTTEDGKPSAQWEQTIFVGLNGPIILTN